MKYKHQIHQSPEERQTALLQEIKIAVEDISVTKEINVDMSETNKLLNDLISKEEDPCNITVELNLT